MHVLALPVSILRFPVVILSLSHLTENSKRVTACSKFMRIIVAIFWGRLNVWCWINGLNNFRKEIKLIVTGSHIDLMYIFFQGLGMSRQVRGIIACPPALSPSLLFLYKGIKDILRENSLRKDYKCISVAKKKKKKNVYKLWKKF